MIGIALRLFSCFSPWKGSATTTGGYERLLSTGIKDGDFRSSEVAIHTPVDHGDEQAEEINKRLMIILQKLD